MGGNALKHYETHRLGRGEYFMTEITFLQEHKDLFGFEPITIPYYHDKESFGDMDLLINRSLIGLSEDEYRQQILEHFCENDSSRMFVNGDVVSIGYENFQIDLIITNYDIIDFAQHYFAYNDLGNLLGRIFHKLGLKFGHDGLHLVLRSPYNSNKILKQINITRSYRSVLDLLEIPEENIKNYFSKGFDTLEEIYQFVMSSKYFDPDIFLLDNRNHKSRVRDRKRSTYNGFLNYIAENHKEDHYSFDRKDSRGIRFPKEEFLNNVIHVEYPHIKRISESVYSRERKDILFKESWNGNKLKEWTGLEGKDLGKFIREHENAALRILSETLSYYAIIHPEFRIDNRYLLEDDTFFSLKNHFIREVDQSIQHKIVHPYKHKENNHD